EPLVELFGVQPLVPGIPCGIDGSQPHGAVISMIQPPRDSDLSGAADNHIGLECSNLVGTGFAQHDAIFNLAIGKIENRQMLYSDDVAGLALFSSTEFARFNRRALHTGFARRD